MSENVKENEILSRATSASTQRTKVPLDAIQFDTDHYCHRDPEALKEENLATLLDSLTLEGLQVPIEVHKVDGKTVLIKGHRRVTACRLLAGKNTPGFTLDMEIEAIEVNGTVHDLLVRSVSDNDVRVNLKGSERIQVVKKLHDFGVPVRRAAGAMGVSEKTYQRDLLIASHSWMLQHVKDRSISTTNAWLLLDEAKKVDHLEVLKEDFDAYVAEKKKKIREKEKLRKAQGAKELRPAEKEVKNQMPNHLISHWVELIRAGERFDEDAHWNYDAGLSPDNKSLKISPINLNLTPASLDKVAKVAGKLSLVVKQLGPVIKGLAEKETGNAMDSVARYDTAYLRELGLTEVADELDEQMRLAQEPDGEEAIPDQVPGREEADLALEVELPPQPAEKVQPEKPKKGGK
jgi:ParB-like chromosome segregation protein Spo0J